MAETYDATVPRLTEASAIRSATEVSPPVAEITATLAMTIPASASPPTLMGVLDLMADILLTSRDRWLGRT